MIRIVKSVQYCLAIVVLLTLPITIFSTPVNTSMNKGFLLGLQFGYLDSDYAADLNMYAPGKQSTKPDGSYFIFRPELGYNFSSRWGLALTGFTFSDTAKSSSADPFRKATINTTNISLLALIHLPLTEDGSWVATIPIGISVMSLSLNYQYKSASDPAPWDSGSSNVDKTAHKTLIAPTIGVEFVHYYTNHWAATFATQYYSSSGKLGDPYFTPISTLDYFSTGLMYEF